MTSSVVDIISPRLRDEMNRKKIAPQALARKAGVGRSFIYDILNGKSGNPTSGKLEAIAKALDISVPYLIYGYATETEMKDRKGYTGIRWLCGQDAFEVEEDESFLPHALIQRVFPSTELLRLFKLRSDEMAPTMQPGDVIMIDTAPAQHFVAGVYAIRDGDHIAIRRLDLVRNNVSPHYRIHADNPNYSAYHVDCERLTIVGKAVWRTGLL